MKVIHFGGEADCENIEALNSILTSRHENDSNEFQLYGSEEYPYITILVSSDWACIHFFEDEDDCGHYAYYANNLLDEDGYTDFYIGSPTARTEISNKLVIPFSLALVAAEDFFLLLKRSDKMQWFEL